MSKPRDFSKLLSKTDFTWTASQEAAQKELRTNGPFVSSSNAPQPIEGELTGHDVTLRNTQGRWQFEEQTKVIVQNPAQGTSTVDKNPLYTNPHYVLEVNIPQTSLDAQMQRTAELEKIAQALIAKGFSNLSSGERLEDHINVGSYGIIVSERLIQAANAAHQSTLTHAAKRGQISHSSDLQERLQNYATLYPAGTQAEQNVRNATAGWERK